MQMGQLFSTQPTGYLHRVHIATSQLGRDVERMIETEGLPDCRLFSERAPV